MIPLERRWLEPLHAHGDKGGPVLKTIIGVLLLAVIALVGYRVSFSKISPFKTGRHLFLTGTEFILVGILLGDYFLGILDPATLNLVRPFLILALGWIGLLSGIQFEWSTLRALAGPAYFWPLLNAGLVLAMVYGGLYALFRPWVGSDPLQLQAISVLAVSSLCTAQASLALHIQQVPSSKRPVGQMLQLVSSLNDAFAIILFGCLMAVSSPAVAGEPALLFPGDKLLFSLLLGILMGVLFLILLRNRLAEAEKIVVVTGLILFGGGMSYVLAVSSLFVCFVAGIIIANFSISKDQTFQFLLRVERPLYLIFLIIAGAYFEYTGTLVLVLAAAYILLRALALGLGGRLFLSRIPGHVALLPTKRLGWGLLSQGGMAVAFAVHFRLWLAPLFDLTLLKTTFSVLLLAILINELIYPFGLSRVLKEEQR